MPDPLIPKPTFRPTAPPVQPTLTVPESDTDFELFGAKFDPVKTVLDDPVKAVTDTVSNATLGPFHLGAHILSHIPTGGLGADEQFETNGARLRADNPDLYAKWQLVKAESADDPFGGGNLRADFNNQVAEFYDSLSPEGLIGNTNTYTSSGSLGGMLSHGLQSLFGFLSNNAQSLIGEAGLLEENTTVQRLLSGEALTRVELLKESAAAGEPISPIEQQALDGIASGWTDRHAADFLVRSGAGLYGDPAKQIVASVATDPLVYAGAIPGLAGKVTQAGRAIAQTTGPTTFAERVAVNMAKVADHPDLGPIFRGAGMVVNPHLPDRPVTTAVRNAQAADGLVAFDRVYRHQTAQLRRWGKEAGNLDQLDRDVMNYVRDQSDAAAAVEAQRVAVAQHLGEELAEHGGIEDIANPTTKVLTSEGFDRLVENMTVNAHDVVQPDDIEQLVRRAARYFGGDISIWRDRVTKAGPDLRSALHAVTHKGAETEFVTGVVPEVNLTAAAKALDVDEATLARMTLLNPRTLDTTLAAEVIRDIGDEQNLSLAVDTWNQYARRYPAMGQIGYASGSKDQLSALTQELDKLIAEHALPRRLEVAELGAPELKPVADFLDRYTVDGQELWRVGFLPEGPTLRRSAITGEYIVDRAPTLGHNFDGAPQRGSRTVGTGLDSLGNFVKRLTDQTTSMQLAMNVRRRFARLSMENLGLPQAAADDIWGAVAEIAGRERTTVRGLVMGPETPVWKAIKEAMPEGHLLPDGTAATPRDIADQLLVAAEGDMSIFGALPVTSQRMRNMVRRMGADDANYSGWLTGTAFNRLRYTNPIFLTQRITDAPWFMALRGQAPVLRGMRDDQLRAAKLLMENVARTGEARAFSFDLPEFATRSNFVDALQRNVAEAAGGEGKLREWADKMATAPDAFIANNMAKMVFNGLGKAVKQTLDDVEAVIGDIEDDVLRAEMEAEWALMRGSRWEDLRGIYSQQAGRILDDNEVGLQFILSHMDSNRKLLLKADGTVDMEPFLNEIDQGLPADAADLGPLHQEEFARALGFESEKALRHELSRELERDALGRIVGGIDREGLLEKARVALPNAHPDYIARVLDYFEGTWDDFWAEATDESKAIFLTKVEAERVQGAIARIAEGRGMNPWEYLTGVVKLNLQHKHKGTTLVKHLKTLARALTPEGDPYDIITHFSEGHLDPSGQAAVLRKFLKSPEGKALSGAPAPAPRPVKPPAPAAPAPHSYDVTAQTAGQGKTGYHYQLTSKGAAGNIHVARSKETFATADEAVAAGNEYGQRLAEKLRADLGLPSPAPAAPVEAAPEEPVYDALASLDEDFRPQYASQGRDVGGDEMLALQTRGKELMNVPPASTPVDLRGAVDKVIKEMHQRTALTEWGGTTFSPRTGHFIEDANPWMYHGTNARFEESIAQAGLNRGEVIEDLRVAQGSALGKGIIYRARKFDIPQVEKAAGWGRIRGKGVEPGKLEVSRDGGQTWERVDPKAPLPDGPWVSGVGKTHSISIADAQDPRKFNKALRKFIADNEAELQRPGMYVGTFRDEKLGVVEFDVARATFSAPDTEAVQAFLGREGGAYNVATGQGLFAPKLVLPTPWKQSKYADVTEEVSLDELARFVEVDREVVPRRAADLPLVGGADLRPGYLDELTDDIRKNGLKEPLIMQYDPVNGGMALLGDGNHRFAVLRRLGQKTAPVRVTRTTGLEKEPKARLLSGPQPDDTGYLKGDMLPSEIGLGAKPLQGTLTAADMMAHRFPEALAGRLRRGTPNANPDVEAIYRAFGQWYRRAVQPNAASPKMVEMLGEVPTEGAAPFSRTEAMTKALLRDKLGALRSDAFMVAEMGMKRSVLMRSINHPILGLYPPAYFWGKVLPLTLKTLGRNPYGLTYDLLAVQRAITIQREIDPEFNEAIEDIGNSETAYLLDYLTPGTPYSGYEVHGPKWMSDLVQGNWRRSAESLAEQLSPLRTIGPAIGTAEELGDILQDLLGGGGDVPAWQQPPPPVGGPTSLVPALEVAQQQLTENLLP